MCSNWLKYVYDRICHNKMFINSRLDFFVIFPSHFQQVYGISTQKWFLLVKIIFLKLQNHPLFLTMIYFQMICDSFYLDTQ